jgi:hypothetical protein
MRVTGVAEAQAAAGRYFRAIEQGAQDGLTTGGKEFTEPWERSHHPWTNRSGDAERELHTFVEPTARGFALVNAHGVSYGKYLELKADGRYAVLAPALRATIGQVLGNVAAAISKRVR